MYTLTLEQDGVPIAADTFETEELETIRRVVHSKREAYPAYARERGILTKLLVVLSIEEP